MKTQRTNTISNNIRMKALALRQRKHNFDAMEKLRESKEHHEDVKREYDSLDALHDIAGDYSQYADISPLPEVHDDNSYEHIQSMAHPELRINHD